MPSINDFFNLVLTDAGRTKVLEASADPMAPRATIETIRFGDAGYAVTDGDGAPLPSAQQQLALQNELASMPLSAGSAEAGLINLFGVLVAGTPEFSIREIGIYLDDGTLFAVGSHPTAILAQRNDAISIPFNYELRLPLDTTAIEVVYGADADTAAILADVTSLQGMIRHYVEDDAGLAWNPADAGLLTTALNQPRDGSALNILTSAPPTPVPGVYLVDGVGFDPCSRGTGPYAVFYDGSAYSCFLDGATSVGDITGLQAALDGKATASQGALADSAVQPGDTPIFGDNLKLLGNPGFDDFLIYSHNDIFHVLADRDNSGVHEQSHPLVLNNATETAGVYGHLVWTAGNDGSGSGLDADLLDGMQASAFATASQGALADSAVQPGDNPEFGNTVKFSSEGGGDDFFLFANSNTFYVLTDRDNNGSWEVPYPMFLVNATETGYIYGDKVWTAGNDGSGSGLDADLLDGMQATAFATAAQGALADSAVQTGDSPTLLDVTVQRLFLEGGQHQINNNDGTGNWNLQLVNAQQISTAAGSPMIWTCGVDNTVEGNQRMSWLLYDVVDGPGVMLSGSTSLTFDRQGLTFNGVKFSLDGHTHPVDRVEVTANHTAVPDQEIYVDTSTGPITVTAPANPTEGAYFYVADDGGTAASNNITVDLGSAGFKGVASDDYIININYFGTGFRFSGGTWKGAK